MPGVFISISKNEMPPCGLPSVLVRTKAENPIGNMRLGRPNLLTIDDIIIAIANGGRAQTGSKVRPRTRLRIALTPKTREPSRICGKCSAFCSSRAKSAEHRPDHCHAERRLTRRVDARGFRLKNGFLRIIPARAAKLLRASQSRPSHCCSALLAIRPFHRATY